MFILTCQRAILGRMFSISIHLRLFNADRFMPHVAEVTVASVSHAILIILYWQAECSISIAQKVLVWHMTVGCTADVA